MATRVLLIGGASHAGKSSLCERLRDAYGWRTMSTDALGRHPGRPWSSDGSAVPPHVVDHYLQLSPDELAENLLDYQRRMWSTIERIVRERLKRSDGPNLVMEGSAMLPELAASLLDERVSSICLVADPELLTARIHTNSGYPSLNALGRLLVDRFNGRNARINQIYSEMAKSNGVRLIDVGAGKSVTDLAGQILA